MAAPLHSPGSAGPDTTLNVRGGQGNRMTTGRGGHLHAGASGPEARVRRDQAEDTIKILYEARRTSQVAGGNKRPGCLELRLRPRRSYIGGVHTEEHFHATRAHSD